jgi:hypothetical protein
VLIAAIFQRFYSNVLKHWADCHPISWIKGRMRTTSWTSMVHQILIELIVGSVPGTPYNNCLQKRLDEAYPTIDEATVHVLTDFLSSVMPMDPRLRPSPAQLLKHRWFANRYSPENSWCLAPTPKELSDPDYPTDSDLDFTGGTTFTLCVCGWQGESTAVFS